MPSVRSAHEGERRRSVTFSFHAKPVQVSQQGMGHMGLASSLNAG
jgi:hypothetical protein